jgi:hypothetical protein
MSLHVCIVLILSAKLRLIQSIAINAKHSENSQSTFFAYILQQGLVGLRVQASVVPQRSCKGTILRVVRNRVKRLSCAAVFDLLIEAVLDLKKF